jgi:hypothetical protein
VLHSERTLHAPRPHYLANKRKHSPLIAGTIAAHSSYRKPAISELPQRPQTARTLVPQNREALIHFENGDTMQEKSMMRSFQNTEPLGNHSVALLNHSVPFGDLVTAVFDSAAGFSDDPKEISRSAVQTVAYMLRHMQLASVTIPPPTPLVKTKPVLRVVSGEKRQKKCFGQ